MNKTIPEVLLEKRSELGKTQGEMAEMLGVSRASYNYYETGRNLPKLEFYKKFKDLFHIDLLDIAATNVTRETKPDYQKERLEQKMTIRTLLVPLVPIKAQAGYIESHHLDEFIERLERFPMAPGINPRGAEWRWFEVQGESMEPTMYEGDYILCSMVPQEDWKNLEDYYAYVIVTINAMWVKRIVKKGGTTIRLHSDNKKVKPRNLDLSEIREVWKVRRQLNARIPPPERIVD